MAHEFRTSAAWLSILSIGFWSAAQAQEGAAVQLEEIVISTTPVPGAKGIDVNKVPALTSTVTPHDFEVQHTPSVTDAITAHVPGAVAINVDGSDLSPDLYYRGFDVSRVSGTAEGLAVYQNGVRINEAFGDSVNLDLVPPIAVDHADVYTNNPIFGLNALGGAINFTMKNGFTFHGGDATILGGSYGRVNGNFEYGKEVGNYSMYVAGDGYRDGGYRPFGAQNAERTYVDFGYRTQDSEVHAIGSYGRSLLGVQGVTPQVLVEQQAYNLVFTTPQTTENQAGLAQLTGRFDLSDHWVLNSNVYFRRFDQHHTDGNDADVNDCADDPGGTPGTLCLSADAAGNDPATGAPFTPAQRQFLTLNSNSPVGSQPDGFPYGTTAHTTTHTTTVGTQQQVTNRDKIYGHDNYFVAGGSVDYSQTYFNSYITLGQLNPQFQNNEFGFPYAGTILQTAGNIGFGPTAVNATASYYGLFALDTFNVTKKFAVTAGARFNIADINLTDLTGINTNLNSSNTYQRINPVIGATYEFAPALTVFGSYSEANRAPTPLESGCADPAKPCVLETALVSDPPLKQVVSHTFEAGARGTYAVPGVLGGTFGYKAAYFHTLSTDDIISQQSPLSGQGYYANVGSTLRQGVELGTIYTHGPLSLYGNYAYVDATYDFNGTLSSPNNPAPVLQNNGGTEPIVPGNHIPGIPRHLVKLGFEYQVTPKFIVGMDGVFVGSQFYVGDDSNLNPQLAAYYFLNAHASYQVTDKIQVFGLIKNLTNNHYATFGTYYDPGTSGEFVAGRGGAILAANDPGNGGPGIGNAITVAQPISFYGGVKVNF